MNCALYLILLFVIVSVSTESISFEELISNPHAHGEGVEFELHAYTNKRGVVERRGYTLHKEHSPYAKDARIFVAGQGYKRIPESHFFTGRITSDIESQVFLTLHESRNVTAWIHDKKSWFTGHLQGDTLALNSHEEGIPGYEDPMHSFKCGTHNHPKSYPYKKRGKKRGKRRFEIDCPTSFSDWQPVYEVRVSFETDHTFYKFFNDSGDHADRAASDHIATVVNRINTMYVRDLGVRLIIAESSFYPELESQPWPSDAQYNAPYDSYRAAALRRLALEYKSGSKSALIPQNNVGIVHLIIGVGVGGEAYLGDVCTQSPFGISGTRRLDLKWETVIIGHEIGHNFNSQHTHCYNKEEDLDCFDYGKLPTPPIDQCNNEEDNCYSGEETIPGTGGSIMSYCDNSKIGGSLDDINLYMGRENYYGNNSSRVNWVIRQFIEQEVRYRYPNCLVESEPEAPLPITVSVADECVRALNISGFGLFPWDNTEATTGILAQNLSSCIIAGESGIGADIWFKWKSTTNNSVTIDTCQLTDVDTKMAVYATNDCQSLKEETLLECSSDDCDFKSRVTFKAQVGKEYLIQLGTYPLSLDSNEVLKTGVGRFKIATAVSASPVAQINDSNTQFWEEYRTYLIIGIVLLSLACICFVCLIICLLVPHKKEDSDEIIEVDNL